MPVNHEYWLHQDVVVRTDYFALDGATINTYHKPDVLTSSDWLWLSTKYYEVLFLSQKPEPR